jgi:beta-N-acetylhexosaminidase
MGMREDLGQLMMIGVAGPGLTREERRFLREVRPAGVIYFKRNIETPGRLRALSESIARELAGSPPLLGIDQEGGRVERLGDPFTSFPGNDFLGRYAEARGRTDLAAAQARATASELASVGINYNFTPVADVDSNPRNPIIGSRSFGSDPKLVAKLVCATVRAYRASRVVCCAKHFPGHGDTSADSHKVLPVVRASRSTLSRRELPPFAAAIRAGVPTIMTAHVIYPALDPKRPATLSPAILGGLLRRRLGFKGVVVSDDLEMNAIAAHGEVHEAGTEAIGAGVDLLLVCKSLERSREVYRGLVRAFEAGGALRSRMEESLDRIAKLKKGYVRPLKRCDSPRGFREGWERHRKLAEKVLRLGEEKFFENR